MDSLDFFTPNAEEFNEIILEMPVVILDESKEAESKIMSASVNEIAITIVDKMIAIVRQDLSTVKQESR